MVWNLQRGAVADSIVDCPVALGSPSRGGLSNVLRIFALDGRYELPSSRIVLRVGESIHRAWVVQVAKGDQIDAPELTGQNRFGQPLGGQHEHSHIFPVDLDDDGAIDHVVVYVPMGMGQSVLDGLLRLRMVYGRGGKPWFGLREARETEGRVIARHMDWLCSVAGGSREWVSWTPFVAPRYMKAHGKNALEGQVRAELLSRGYRASEDEVEIVDLGLGREYFGGYELSRREGRTRPPMEVGHGIRLCFREPVAGPIVIGYGSHFGLGLFRAVG